MNETAYPFITKFFRIVSISAVMIKISLWSILIHAAIQIITVLVDTESRIIIVLMIFLWLAYTLFENPKGSTSEVPFGKLDYSQ